MYLLLYYFFYTISNQILEDFVLKGQNLVCLPLQMDEYQQFAPKTNPPAFLA